jgi:hypothetical protein
MSFSTCGTLWSLRAGVLLHGASKAIVVEAASSLEVDGMASCDSIGIGIVGGGGTV